MTIRMTPELADLVRRCAAHCGMGVSDVLRRTAAYLRRIGRERMCNNSNDTKCYTNGRPCNKSDDGQRYTATIRARDVELPDGVTPDDFREALAFRCRDAMTRPSCKEVNINFLCMNGDGLTPQAIDKEA